MGFFSRLFGNNKSKNDKTSATNKAMETESHLSSKNIIDTMLMTASVSMDNGDYEKVVEIYKDILKLEPNAIAQSNLGSLYAQGKGIKQNFMEAAYWFRQAELSGDELAGKLCLKCSMDFTHLNFEEKSAKQIYFEMVKFIQYVYPDTKDVNLEVCRRLYAMASNHFNKHEYYFAAKLFRAAGEFGNDGYSQNYLAVLYNLGLGVEQDDLVALYWFDKAIDNGAADIAKQDRDGILNAYKENFSPDEFSNIMLKLSMICQTGNDDISKDVNKSLYWNKLAKI